MSFKHDVLMTDGNFRIARAYHGTRPTDKGKRWILIQHDCSAAQKEFNSEFDDGTWRLCWSDTRQCSNCLVKVPAELVGFHEMIMWNNTKDCL